MDFAALRSAMKTAKPSEGQRRLLMKAIGYEPHPEQEAFHFSKDPRTDEELRFKLVAGGEQAGKSYSAAVEMFSHIFWGSLFWIVGPQYDQAQREFDYLEAFCQRIGIWKKSNKPAKGEWRMETITGQVIETLSAVKVATIAGKAPDGILFVEAAQSEYEAFLRVMGRAGPKKSWVCINGTFEKDSGTWYRQLWKAWQSPENPHGGKSFSLPTWTNRTYYPLGREDPEIKRLESLDPDPSKAHFWERFGGVPSSPRNIVFREFNFATHVKRIRRVPNDKWDPAMMWRDPNEVVLPEETEDQIWVDPGYSNAYAVLFVSIVGETVVVYDELYKQYTTSEKMAALAAKHPRWDYIKRIVMDISGHHKMGGNRSAQDHWYQVTGLRSVAKYVQITDGLERTRTSLALHPETRIPGMVFDPKCEKTIWELSEGYKYPADKMGNPLGSDKPEDKNNHAAKAIAYGLTLAFGSVSRRPKTGKGKRHRTIAGWELLRDLYSR